VSRAYVTTEAKTTTLRPVSLAARRRVMPSSAHMRVTPSAKYARIRMLDH
jgi:hypothetical protein